MSVFYKDFYDLCLLDSRMRNTMLKIKFEEIKLDKMVRAPVDHSTTDLTDKLTGHIDIFTTKIEEFLCNNYDEYITVDPIGPFDTYVRKIKISIKPELRHQVELLHKWLLRLKCGQEAFDLVEISDIRYKNRISFVYKIVDAEFCESIESSIPKALPLVDVCRALVAVIFGKFW